MFIYLKTMHRANIMTGAKKEVNQVNLHDNNSIFQNTTVIDNYIVKLKGSGFVNMGVVQQKLLLNIIFNCVEATTDTF